MKAIVEISGKQYPVAEQGALIVDRLAAKEGETVTFNKVLVLHNGTTSELGKPYLSATITATVVRHLRHKKVVSRTYRRRQGYHRTYGHRQGATEINVQSITRE